MSFLRRKIDWLRFYFYIVNPFVPKKHRILQAFAKDTREHYDFLEKSQWWLRAELENYQNEKLAKLVRHAYKNVPYYKKLFDQNKISPDDIKTAADLTKVPILTKTSIRKNFPHKIVRPGSYDGLPFCTTGGSTGEPLEFFADEQSSAFAWASFFRFLRWAGYIWGDKVNIFFRGFPNNPNQKIYEGMLDLLRKRYVPNLKYYNASKMDDESLARYINEIGENTNSVLRGYASALKHLAVYIRNKKIDPIHPRFITTTGDALHDVDRELLKNVFKCDVFDQYGCTEIMGVANECPAHVGLHISSEHVVVEIVDEKGEKVSDGEYGQLAITDLDNYTMPFIRYVNGDGGRLLKRKCTCGRTLPMMDYVSGRSVDVIKGVNGAIAHGLYFVTLLKEAGLYESHNILDYEIVQRKKDVLECNFVFKNKPSPEAVGAFKNACRDNFGDMKININFLNEIPKSVSGKRRFIRSEISTD